MNKNNKKKIREILLIMIAGGVPTAYLMCPGCFDTAEYAGYAILYNALIWLSLWKGNEWIAHKTDPHISWLKTPVKRFFISLGLMIAYTSLAAATLTVLFYIFAFNREFNRNLLNSILETSLFAIGVTTVIMLVIFARNFLESWRQSEINAEKLRHEQVTLQYETLRNQVNPHFLFNTLNALSSLIYEDRDKAIVFINKFSDVYRYVLDSRDKEVVPLEEELNFVESFVYLMKTRYEDNLIFRMDLDPGNEWFVPPMSLQLLVENAVKHNVISENKPLHIHIGRSGDHVFVENNLNLKTADKNHEGLGLTNIRSRYEILSDKPVRIEQDDNTFKVSIPVLQIK